MDSQNLLIDLYVLISDLGIEKIPGPDQPARTGNDNPDPTFFPENEIYTNP
jgi:hypothetical protein